MHLRAYLTILDGDIDLVPFWLRLRARWGVDEVYLIVYDSTPSKARAIQQRIRHTADLLNCPLTLGPTLDEADFRAAGREALIAEIHAAECEGQWGLFSDADEFPHVPGNDMRGFLRANIDHLPYLGAPWLDRVAPDGRLAEVRDDVMLEAQFPLACNVRRQLGQNDTAYIASPFGPVSHHPSHCQIGKRYWPHVNKIASSNSIRVHHFKWNCSTLRRLKRRLERINNPRHQWARGVKKQVDYLERRSGAVDIERVRELGSVLGV